VLAKNISPYLVEGSDAVVLPRSTPICDVPEFIFGSKATDGGHLIMDQRERALLVSKYPAAAKFVRRYVSAEDFLHDVPRYCLWLVDGNPSEWGEITPIVDRVKAVREFRLASAKATTREDAKRPSVFAELRQPQHRFLAIPKTSSERRAYIPMAFLSKTVVVASEIYFCEGADLFQFGILSSGLHMAWMRQVCGRLESRYRYSNKLVYNNFPWPQRFPAVFGGIDVHLP